ncbi:MAG: DUF2914 domain-containing protein [Bdellovibrionales bacterium]|nr:DUF2914 domain-containing protein [Bdellovibrionales bacterium]
MKQLIATYKPYFPASFFLGGFAFDLLTVSRIDDSFQLLQQFVYLAVIGGFLIADKSVRVSHLFQHRFLSKLWPYRHEVIHFFLGALLSVYMIFYFKSASLWSSFIFIGGFALLLVLNEFQMVKDIGDIIRFGLFALCSCSYFVYLIPVMWQHIGFFTFLFSLVISGIFYLSFIYLISKFENITQKELVRDIFLPGAFVHVLFLVLYLTAFLPPVPLSVEKMGIYHRIQKENGNFVLSYDRPWYKIWERGAQTFIAEPNDKIYCFTSVFAPSFFKESINMEWWFKTAKGWSKTDTVPMQVMGGRDLGFRGYTTKQNFTDGEMQVRVTTSDGRELGRIYLTVQKSPTTTPDRPFHSESY